MISLADTYKNIIAGSSPEAALAEFFFAFDRASSVDALISALEDAPPLTGDIKLDALAGAVAEYLARQHRLSLIPKWAFEGNRYLEHAWHTCPFEDHGLRSYLSYASPGEFKSRNIFTDERPTRPEGTHLLLALRSMSRPSSEPTYSSTLDPMYPPASHGGMIIAIDGPAASGKGTLGKRIALHYGLRHLDTGLIYRAVAKALIDANRDLADEQEAAAAAQALDPAAFDDKILKTHEIAEAASIVSALPQVRAALVAFQREFGRAPPGAVLDGRDIGTVIFPDADIKIFVTASAQVRAGRRAAELKAAGNPVSEAEVLADILHRDERDTKRAAAPLKPAPDAHLLDTTHLDIDAAFRAAVDIIEAVRAGRKRG